MRKKELIAQNQELKNDIKTLISSSSFAIVFGIAQKYNQQFELEAIREKTALPDRLISGNGIWHLVKKTQEIEDERLQKDIDECATCLEYGQNNCLVHVK